MRRIRRAFEFLASRAFALMVVVSLLIMAFYTALNTANIWVLIDNGLEARAAAVIQGGDASRLQGYFAQEFIQKDPVLAAGLSQASPYRDYSIRSITHKTHFHSIWAWPWESVARAEVTESIPSIEGSILPSLRESITLSGGKERLSPPAWETRRYRVTLVRTSGQWRISGLQMMGN